MVGIQREEEPRDQVECSHRLCKALAHGGSTLQKELQPPRRSCESTVVRESGFSPGACADYVSWSILTSAQKAPWGKDGFRQRQNLFCLLSCLFSSIIYVQGSDDQEAHSVFTFVVLELSLPAALWTLEKSPYVPGSRRLFSPSGKHEAYAGLFKCFKKLLPLSVFCCYNNIMI